MNNKKYNKFELSIIDFMVSTILLLPFFIACNNNPKTINSPSVKIDSNFIERENGGYSSGKYGDMSIAISGKEITGVYEYYDNWSEKDREFLDVNVFYFEGYFIDDSTASIKTSWPGSQQVLKGTIVFAKEEKKDSSGFRIKLNDQPFGYNDVDFTQPQGVKMRLTEKTSWLQIKLVGVKKINTYSNPSDKDLRKSYLIYNDIVKILKRDKSGFVEIEYDSPLDKKYIYWVKEADLN